MTESLRLYFICIVHSVCVRYIALFVRQQQNTHYFYGSFNSNEHIYRNRIKLQSATFFSKHRFAITLCSFTTCLGVHTNCIVDKTFAVRSDGVRPISICRNILYALQCFKPTLFVEKRLIVNNT